MFKWSTCELYSKTLKKEKRKEFASFYLGNGKIVYISKLQAYQKYGDSALKENCLYIDGNTSNCSYDNITIKTEFDKYLTENDKYYCNSCNSILDSKDVYNNTNPHRIRQCKKCSRNKRLKKYNFATSFKTVGCCICGEKDVACLDFHHLGNKTTQVSWMQSNSYKAIKEEIDKCVVICANCHRKLHYYKLTLQDLKKMVDFTKKIKNSNKFRLSAITFLQTGRYCPYPEATSEFFKFWDLESERCVDGYTADDGDFISGYNYFYLNYCPIQRIVYTVLENKKVKKTRELLFPDFYDYDYYFFLAMLEAEDEGKHLCALKSRRKGYSYKNAAMACRNYYLIPGSKTYIYASNKQYLTEDGILTKAWDYMDFIDKNTAWGKKRSVNTQMRKRAGFFTKDEYGNLVELGYKSEIIGVTLKDNPDVVRGKAGKLIIFEEAGSFSELGAAWQIARPSVEQDGVAFGTMVAFGTGGDEGSHFETLKDMFYNPDGYNCLSFKNIWDESAATKECGFFIPQYTNLDFRDTEGNRIYMDSDGNTMRKKSLEFILEERRKVIENATSNNTIDRYVAEHCLTPSEACLEFNGNIFPKKELLELLALLRTNKKLLNHKLIGDLVWLPDGSLKWIIKKTGDITRYPLRQGDDPTGSIVIWEHPNKEASAGLYIAGIDSYDYDESSTTSLGSCFIYKRVLSIESYSDIIVAEYTGRPKSAEEFYENVRKLLIYYNARAMYENQNKGIFVYFTNKHCDYLLADQPDIINDIVSNSKVNRKKGCHMNKQIKLWGWGLIKDWLNDINADGKKNLYNIMSEPLLEELISANDVVNVDRVMALTLVMIYREQLYNIKVKEIKKENRNRVLFEGPIFTQEWFHDDGTNNLEAYMF